jgi:hypothetical protein
LFDVLNRERVKYWRQRIVPLIRPARPFRPIERAILYMAFGFSALYFSDRLLVQWIPDQAILREVQMVKGGLEVVLTAVFIVFVTYRSRSRLTD